MNKIKINMVGGGFQHDVCSSALNTNTHIEWVKDGSANISIHIDNAILNNIDPIKESYGWLAESSSIIPKIINTVTSNVEQYKSKFKYIFTHDRRVIEKDPEFFKFTPPNGLPWIRNKQIYEKTKNISFIVSNKRMTSGHNFRLNALNKFKGSVDHFGRGFSNSLPWTYNYGGIEESGKLLGLKDYRYSFVFENDNYPSIFCEKLTDCFATGTIPIFWGTSDIDEFFDVGGIVMYNENLDISMLTPEFYESKMEHIKNNFKLCNEMVTSEDYIYLNYIK
jgi:hypothetical protein